MLIATHENPDADAIGAVYAVSRILEHFKKPATLFLPDGIPPHLTFLQNNAPRHTDTASLQGDALVALDYGDFPRTRLQEFVDSRHLRIASIDHHPLSDHRGEVVIVDTNASSTCEILYRFCLTLGIPISKDLATCLLAGIVFDTGAMQHSNTSSETLTAASDLVRHGARMHKIAQAMHAREEQSALRLIADALSHIVFDQELGMSYTVVTYDQIANLNSEADLSIITHLLGTGDEQKFSAFFKEVEPKKFRVSLRSEEFRGVDVSEIAKQFGGGGHRYASGCQIEGEFSDVLDKIRIAARQTTEQSSVS